MTGGPTTVAHPPSGRLPVLRISDLAVSFGSGRGARTPAVDGVRLTLYSGQTLAVVGESGCGKSVTALTTLGLIPCPPGRVDRGRIEFRSRSGELINLVQARPAHLRAIRGNEIAMIFQEPMSSLNPVFTIGQQIVEAIRLHRKASERDAREIAVRAMADVGIPDPESRLGAYPHQFSGGMRQRVMIAMALACRPRVLLADEPTTALDVTIQAQILELLAKLKRTRELAILLITHDLGVVAEHADVVCVMYAGRVVEYARVDLIYDKPMHPYTRGLLASIPKLGQRTQRLTTIADVVGDEREFDQLGGVRPWWPWHEPPKGIVRGEGDSVLFEAEPDHWIAVWRNGIATNQREPDLDWRREDCVEEVLR